MNNQPQQLNQNILFETVYTQGDLLLFYKEVDQIISALFTGNGSFEEKLNTLISPEKRRNILLFLTQEKVRPTNAVEIKEALSKIQKLGVKLPVVTLTLAFEPTENMIKELSVWFIKKFSQKVILDIRLERRMLGGAYISFNGLYKDYTLETKVDKYFEKKLS